MIPHSWLKEQFTSAIGRGLESVAIGIQGLAVSGVPKGADERLAADLGTSVSRNFSPPKQDNIWTSIWRWNISSRFAWNGCQLKETDISYSKFEHYGFGHWAQDSCWRRTKSSFCDVHGKNTMRHFEKHLVILSGRISSVYKGFS